MEIVKTLQNIVNELDNIDTYDEGLAGRLSEIDQKIQDLLHYIEVNKISILWSYKYMAELKKLRVERRQIKNDMYLLTKFNEHKNKMISSGNRQFLMSEMYKAEKQLETPYKNRQYKDGEIEDILKSKKDKTNKEIHSGTSKQIKIKRCSVNGKEEDKSEQY